MRGRFRRVGRWLDRQTKERPFFSALVVLTLVMVPGYARLEDTVNTAESAATSSAATAKEVAKIVNAEKERAAEVLLVNCQTRNSAQQNGRERFDKFFTAIEVIFTSSPEMTEDRKRRTKEFVQNLRNSVPLDPLTEDVDCNQDGRLGPKDYAPPYSTQQKKGSDPGG